MWLENEMRKNLPIELDFINEAKNIEVVEKILANHKFVKVLDILNNHLKLIYCKENFIFIYIFLLGTKSLLEILLRSSADYGILRRLSNRQFRVYKGKQT